MKKRICVIGAGVAGLCCLRHLTTTPNRQKFEVIAFEEKSEIGGIWVYTPDASAGTYTRPNPMYRDMKTNLPKEVMCYPDFPFKASQDSFLHHSAVLEYLQDYAAHFGLDKFVQFRKRVELVHPIVENGQVLKWEVTVQDLLNGDQRTRLFDVVMVCSGHFSKPHLPIVPNLSSFTGRILHSQAYRSAEEYASESVVVVGSKFSAIDIALEIAGVGMSTEVALSIRRPDALSKMELPSNVRQVGPIEHATSAGVVCKTLQAKAQGQGTDGAKEEFVKVEADAIIFCTGYEYEFPFLSPACETRVESDGKFVTPLYKELVHARFPSLCFVGLQQLVIPFIMVDVQVRYYVAWLEGRFQIPQNVAADSKTRTSSDSEGSGSHILGTRQWPYYEDLAAEAGLELEQDSDGLYPCVFGSFVVPDKRLSLRERNDFIVRMNDAIGPRREIMPALFKSDKFQVWLAQNSELDFTFVKYEPKIKKIKDS